MNKIVSTCALLCWITIWISCVAAFPMALSDQNYFLKNFVNEPFLNFIGVIATITLASSANLFMEMNKIEDAIDKPVFKKAKVSVKNSAYWLIALLVCAVLIVIIKPIGCGGDRYQAFMNGAAVTVIVFGVLILIDITKSVFMMDPRAD